MGLAAVVLASSSPGFVGAPRHLSLEGGRPLVRVVVEAAVASACDVVVVVTGGPRADRVDAALAGLDVVILSNSRWMEGAASSVRTGVAWADAQGFDTVAIAPADRNRASAAHFDALVRLHRRGHEMVATRHAEVLGLPAVFGRSSFRALMGLLGDRGPADVLASADSVGAVEWCDADEIEPPKRSGFRIAAVRTTRGRVRRGS